MGFDPQWYTTHSTEPKSNVSLDGITLEQFDVFVNKAALTNQDRTAAAIEKSDGYAFQVANPWFKPTESNLKIVNKWLESKGVRYGTYPDIEKAAEELAAAGVVSVDEAAYASHLDGNDPKKFVGALTKRVYTDRDTMILQEREAAIQQLGAEQPSDIERALDSLPLEDQRKMFDDALNTHQAKADGVITQQNADAWVSMTPEYRDDERNARLLTLQLKRNGVTGAATIEDLEVANRQLVSSGLVRQNPAALKKQEAAEVFARAQHAVKNSAAFDTTSENAMYELPLDEVRRRANGNFTGVGY